MKQDMNTFVPNEKMKPVKIRGYPLQVKKADTNKLLSLIKANRSEKPAEGNNSLTSLKTFQDVNQLAVKSEIKSIIVKVITLSKEIQGAYGPIRLQR